MKVHLPALSRRRLLQGSALLLAQGGLAACQIPREADRFAKADALIQQAISNGECPGVVWGVGQHGHLIHRGVFGARSLEPQCEAMTWDTVFDMASLTKPMITALAVMQLVEKGLVDVDAPVARYLPQFAAGGKEQITVRLLLTHFSGLQPDLPRHPDWWGKAAATERVMQAVPKQPPGSGFIYSDLNFIALGLLVEKITLQTLNVYAQKNILAPLDMVQSGFLPPASLQARIAPTQYDEHGHMLRGVVHDPTARRMDGVAGNAGLFSTADDVTRYAQALLDKRAGRPSPFPLTRATLLCMTTPQQPAGQKSLRGFGWDIASPYATPRGDRLSRTSFGHTGFTGTSLWIDPDNDCYVFILTNRVHPNGGHSVVHLRHDVATAVGDALGLPLSGP
ncbi:beta-lactamase [Acetobacter tropicalis NRIC 0312]|uniref:Esterase n=1 Tax=Acetobacter tropicalis TaxID=104102 RepID=A0A511FLZ2_9PROT|nr:serine hydrolase domain-containing protein [Acetobacter tropicalis]GAL96501.1 beta-lactamase [Acetobacter tropicalis]GBR69200.1 beta-lactamase [Acetobacter tropicalis NRIC 0312]GEL50256.1 esterase [Acetobacter tropicalis]